MRTFTFFIITFLLSAHSFASISKRAEIAIKTAVLNSEVFGCTGLLKKNRFSIDEIHVVMNTLDTFTATLLLKSHKAASVFAVAKAKGRLTKEADKISAKIDHKEIDSLIYANGEATLESFIKSSSEDKKDDVRDPVSSWYANMVRSHLESSLSSFGLQNIMVTLERPETIDAEKKQKQEEAALFRDTAMEVRNEKELNGNYRHVGKDSFMREVNRRMAESERTHRYSLYREPEVPMGNRPSQYLRVEFEGPEALVNGIRDVLKKMERYRGILLDVK